MAADHHIKIDGKRWLLRFTPLKGDAAGWTFFDNSARTLVYTVSGADGTYTIGGVVSLDGADQTSTGQTVATQGPVGASLVVVSGAPADGVVAGGGDRGRGGRSGFEDGGWTVARTRHVARPLRTKCKSRIV